MKGRSQMHKIEGGGCREIMLSYQPEHITSHFFSSWDSNNSIAGMLAECFFKKPAFPECFNTSFYIHTVGIVFLGFFMLPP